MKRSRNYFMPGSFRWKRAIQKAALTRQAALTDLAGVYHNLLRLWADS